MGGGRREYARVGKAVAVCRDSVLWCRQETIFVQAASPRIIYSLGSGKKAAFSATATRRRLGGGALSS